MQVFTSFQTYQSKSRTCTKHWAQAPPPWPHCWLREMLGRAIPRSLKRFAPLFGAFVLGYILKCLDSPQEQLSGLENDLPLFSGPSLSLLVLVISSPGNSAVRETIRNTWLSVSKKKIGRAHV